MTESTDTTGQTRPAPEYLYLDFEVSNGRIRDIGAIRGEETFRRKNGSPKSLEALAEFSEGSFSVVGHNLIKHDLECLRAIQPSNPVLDLPVVDTLLLSPLCFPENPYHKLIKGYKLVRDSLSNPVEDAILSGWLFADEIEKLKGLRETSPERVSFYRSCLTGQGASPKAREGFELFFEGLRIPAANPRVMEEVFRNAITNLVCIEALDTFIEEKFPPGPLHAYILAWLLVAGSSSVLPPWVRHSHKEIPELLKGLRDRCCTSPDCHYCQTTHNAQKQLKQYFNFDNFRPEPSADDGSSLQEAIVAEGMREKPLLAILPTGGGKSLGFQIPALVRHYRRGVLTIVLSPLQALMKDQVDNLRSLTKMHSPIDAIYGLQPLPERGAIYEKLILGDIAILYVSPEQLRNKRFREAIAQREIGCWVFDEAHCLSKWGHDFRPDYTYAGRFIRELAIKQGEPSPPPVACFTATAKLDVKEELLEYFKNELGQELKVFDGGTERINLTYDVKVVTEHQKPSAVYELLFDHIHDSEAGAAVIFCATRKKVERLAGHLNEKGHSVAGFHGGLDNEKKKQILNDFNNGNKQIICATNAFGMGVDKSDIRLVLHHDIPSSLENYIQEAGRAGRDQQPAHCVLLYNPGENGKGGDIDTQFTLDSFGRITQTDIRDILRSIRYRQKKEKTKDQDQTPHVHLSTSQILDEIETSFDEDIAAFRDTKVRTAIANLENTGFLHRNENRNQVFQGTPLVETMKEANGIIHKQNLSPLQVTAWKEIYKTFLNLPRDEQPDLEEFTKLSSLEPLLNKKDSNNDATRVVFRALNSMAVVGLIKKDISYSAILRYKVTESSDQTYSKFCQLEKAVLDQFRELAPDAQPDEPQRLNINSIVTRLRQEKFPWCLPEHILRLLGALRLDGADFSGRKGSLIPRELGRGQFSIKLQHSWDYIVNLSDKRLHIAGTILKCIHKKIPDDAVKSATLQVSFDESDLLRALDGDLFLKSEIEDPYAAIQVGLRYLHESGILQIKSGIALITQAMRLDLDKGSFGRRYTTGDHQPLQVYYTEKNLQIHVIAEYARLLGKDRTQAPHFVPDYFTLGKTDFIKKYFEGRAELLEKATSIESYHRIVENLNNPYQQSIVSAKSNKNLLILAGPGSGKTRTVAHRCAYLLRVERIKPQRLLVLCYNRSAVITLRHRISDLAGRDAWGITISTFHSLAMRLLGISAADTFSQGFDEFIPEATALLDGSTEIPGMDTDEILHSLIGDWSHILIDEYQDINQEQYDFVSAIAGRVRKNPDTKLSILAVGDDDQNIYEFRGASTQFIRQFEKDYEAESRHLVENYRSTANIISAGNHLIAQNRARMKTDHPIRINEARKSRPPGGDGQHLDPLGKGLVQILSANNAPAQLATILAEIRRLQNLSSQDDSWENFAILGQGRPQLDPMRAFLEANDIPVQWACGHDQGFRLSRVREIQEGFDVLNDCIFKKEGPCEANADELRDLLPPPAGHDNSPWQYLFQKLLQDWCCEIGEDSAPLESCIHFLYDALAQMETEHRYGEGIFLGTAHSAKGLEFKNVLILDGGWNHNPQKLEEKRRLYYVAMTRAMENLVLLQCDDCNNPFTRTVSEANGTFLRKAPNTHSPDPKILFRRYNLLGMEDLYLDLGSIETAVRENISQLQPGDPLTLRELQNKVFLFNSAEQKVGQLSKNAIDAWQAKLSSIESAKVFAIVRRHKIDSTPEFQLNCIAETWEVPLVEVVVRAS